MRLIVLGVVLATSFFTAAVSTSPVKAQDYYFLKITSPVDKQNYAPGVTSNITGVLRIPDSTTDKDSLLLRFRVFRPGNKTFVIEAESLEEVKNLPKGKPVVAFQGSLTIPKEQGQYLLRVDCLNRNVAGFPKNLVASQSLFIKVQVPKLKDGTHHTVTITTPEDTNTYGTGAGITPAGNSTEDNVKKIRLRLVQDSTIMQESIVNVVTGSWFGILAAPTGGWKKGDARLEAQGLDACNSPVLGESGNVKLKIE
jgi:hypothetical protein